MKNNKIEFIRYLSLVLSVIFMFTIANKLITGLSIGLGIFLGYIIILIIWPKKKNNNEELKLNTYFNYVLQSLLLLSLGLIYHLSIILIFLSIFVSILIIKLLSKFLLK